MLRKAFLGIMALSATALTLATVAPISSHNGLAAGTTFANGINLNGMRYNGLSLNGPLIQGTSTSGAAIASGEIVDVNSLRVVRIELPARASASASR